MNGSAVSVGPTVDTMSSSDRSGPTASNILIPVTAAKVESARDTSTILRDADATRRLAIDRPRGSLEPIQKWNLRRLQLPTRPVEGEPFDAVDLGEGLHTPRPGRPLQLVGIADRGRRIQVSPGRPRQDELPRLLPDLTQLDERGIGELVSGFLRELSAGDRHQLLSLLDLAFGDRPVTQVLVHPMRTAHVRQQHLQAIVAAAPSRMPALVRPDLSVVTATSWALGSAWPRRG